MDTIKKILCGEQRGLGDVAEFFVGSAKVCWCCTFWRTCATAGILMFIAGIILGSSL